MKKVFTLSLLVILFGFSIAYADDSADKQIAPKQYGTVIRKIPLVEQNGALSRLAGYRVVYEYLGKQYSVLMPEDPGDKVVILAPPAGINTAPTVQMSAAVPIKPPTTAEINTALTPPVTMMIAPGYPPFYAIPPMRYLDPYYPWYPYYPYPGYIYGPMIGFGLYFGY